jgi:hypothetical protein
VLTFATGGSVGREGAIVQLYLLLHAVRSEDFRSMIDPAQEPVLTPFNYHWMQALHKLPMYLLM